MNSLENFPAASDQVVTVTAESTQAVAALREFSERVMLAGLGNEGTRDVYRTALNQFLDWMVHEGKRFDRADVQAYIAHLTQTGRASATRNGALIVIRRLAKEAYFAGKLAHETYLGIADLKGAKVQKVRAANWLTLRQVNELLKLPNAKTLKGLRDRAMLGVLVGCALRRSEVCDLTIGSVEQRSGRWVFVVRGKGDKTRIVGIAPGLKVSVDEWVGSLEFDDAEGNRLPEMVVNATPLFPAVRKGGTPTTRRLSMQSIQDVLREYAAQMNPPLPKLAPHDLRRTHARLAREAGIDLEQIQFVLGHESISTTQVYLGNNQNLNRTSGDVLDVDWSGGSATR